MAALVGMGIDNAVVRVSGGRLGELPAGDGSSQPFVEALTDAGAVEQDADRTPLVIQKPIQVAHGDATLAALPGPVDHLEILYEFEAPLPVGRQTYSFHLWPGTSNGNDDFVTQLAPARTFIFEHEAGDLRAGVSVNT